MSKKAKWPYKHSKHINIPVYGGDLFLFDDYKYLSQAYDVLGYDEDNPCGNSAGSCSYFEGEDGSIVYLIYVADKQLSTMVHELQHLLHHVAERAGFHVEDGNGEPVCYLAGELFIQIRKGFKKKFGYDLE